MDHLPLASGMPPPSHPQGSSLVRNASYLLGTFQHAHGQETILSCNKVLGLLGVGDAFRAYLRDI